MRPCGEAFPTDVFNDEAGRDAHLAGEVAKALMAKAPELFSTVAENRES